MSSASHVRKCEFCGTMGRVRDSRTTDGVTVRRLECARGHRFTTVEIRPRVSITGRALTGRYRA